MALSESCCRECGADLALIGVWHVPGCPNDHARASIGNPRVMPRVSVPPGEAWFVTTDIKHEVFPDGARVTVTHRVQGKITGLSNA